MRYTCSHSTSNSRVSNESCIEMSYSSPYCSLEPQYQAAEAKRQTAPDNYSYCALGLKQLSRTIPRNLPIPALGGRDLAWEEWQQGPGKTGGRLSWKGSNSTTKPDKEQAIPWLPFKVPVSLPSLFPFALPQMRLESKVNFSRGVSREARYKRRGLNSQNSPAP